MSGRNKNNKYSKILGKRTQEQDEIQNDDNEKVIRHKPNRIILFLSETKWYWPLILIFTGFIGYSIYVPTTPENNPSTLEGIFFSFYFISGLTALVLYIGIRLGANLYRPRETHLTKKTLRLFDELLGKSDEMEIKFIKKDGSVQIIAEEFEVTSND